MELLVATLCDNASESQGKLNVLGAFDAIVAQSFPVGFSFSLALRFSFTKEDQGNHKFSIVFVDESEPASDAAGEGYDLQVNLPDGATGFAVQNLVTPLQGTIAKAGIYHFAICFDGRVIARIPLRVIAQSEIAQNA